MVKSLIGVGVWLLLSLSGIVLGADSRPNVLLVLVDDLKPAIGCYGDPHAKTPNIDRLAARGMRLDLAYCNQAVCAPSRFTLMLGSHSTSTGLYGLGSQLRQIVPDAVTMPQYFAAHGYRTESLGKIFHIGHGNYGDPASFSVAHFHDKVIEYLDPESTEGGKLTREEAYFTNQKLGQIRSLPRGAAFENPQVADDAYADGRVANEAIKRLEQAKQRRNQDNTPFFIAVGFARPHLPFSAPQRYWDMHDPNKLPLPQYEDLPQGAPDVAGKRGGEISNYRPVPLQGEFEASLKRQLIHGYYASTSFVDAQIGRVIDALDRLELTNNTVVVLWGDHGFHLGDLGIWTKHTNYEQANRIPILVVAPGVTAPGSSSMQPAESVDIYPTLAELAGLPLPAGPQPLDGVSLVPVLKDPSARVRNHAYHAYPRRRLGQAIRDERYRLVQWCNPDEPLHTALYELYDYQSDPQERRNLIEDLPEVAKRLKLILQQYPKPVSRNPVSRRGGTKTPKIAGRTISISAVVDSQKPHGVVVAQGGKVHGFALHFKEGIAMLDVRIDGKVTRLVATGAATGKVQLQAEISKRQLSLVVGKKEYTAGSAGLIPSEPSDPRAIGHDSQTAAGDYQAPNPFNGKVVACEVKTTK